MEGGYEKFWSVLEACTDLEQIEKKNKPRFSWLTQVQLADRGLTG